MIIFDLDGTLADCEHRRHLVDRDKAAEMNICYEEVEITFGGVQNGPWVLNEDCNRLWKPDWPAFYEACDKDVPVESVSEILDVLSIFHDDIQIWSSRCESVREKTVNWLYENIAYTGQHLKMRPVGDNTPDHVLKERWLNEFCIATNELSGRLTNVNHNIDFVFDSDPKSIEMWRRRGVFVFNCCQHSERF